MGDMRIRVDASQLDDLIADFDDVPDEVMPEVVKVTRTSARHVARGWADRWKGHPDIKHLPRAIGFDLARAGHTVAAEIGPDHHTLQGPLANLIEFGTLHNPPIPGGQPALDAEEPRYVAALEQALTEAVKEVKSRHGR